MKEAPWVRLLVSLADVQLSEAEKATRIPIAVVGTFHKGRQKFTISRADVAAMSENLAKRGNGEVVIDYEHASDNPEVALGGPVPAAGWIKSLEATPDANGIIWASASFNDTARQMIAANEYKYGSPVIKWGVIDKSTGKPQGATLTSFALTNTPVLDQMPAIRLSEASDEEEAVVEKKDVMCSEHPQTPMLCPECDKAKMMNLTASEHMRSAPKVVRLSEVTRDSKGLIDLGSLGVDAVVSIDVVRAMGIEQVALSEVAAAVTAGKITPAQREDFTAIALSDVERFRRMVKTLPVQVDLSERGIGGDGGGGVALSEIEKIDSQFRALTLAKVKDTGKPYGDCLKLVASENSALTGRRRELMRGRKTAGAEEGEDE